MLNNFFITTVFIINNTRLGPRAGRKQVKTEENGTKIKLFKQKMLISQVADRPTRSKHQCRSSLLPIGARPSLPPAASHRSPAGWPAHRRAGPRQSRKLDATSPTHTQGMFCHSSECALAPRDTGGGTSTATSLESSSSSLV